MSPRNVAMHLKGALLPGKKYSPQPRMGDFNENEPADLCKTMSAADV